MKDPKKYRTRVGEAIAAKMEKVGMSILDLAVKVDTSYEHARRVVKGEAPPSDRLCRDISRVLEIPMETLSELMEQDRIRLRYGGVLPESITGKKPDMEPLERVWDDLKPAQKENLVALAASMVRQNRAEGTL
ncbi:MAG TPA: helix-turn-helix transcriptional regulator [Bryobacteraceae bacterium]|nr:helix-turn-helix transcriptional regulator [Bryobacteraceae bacterium]